ncbi:MAG: hypothetical protein ACI89L_002092 [Phycisphaerales bacterium]|jgi:hypothetical protein
MSGSGSQAERVVVVHQMGKVGSIEIHKALRERGGVQAEFTHLLNRAAIAAYVRRKRADGSPIPEHVGASAHLWRMIRRTDRPIDFVCAVRGPMARNISAMFQNLPASIGLEPTPDALEAINRRFLNHYPHSTPLWWFDRQLKEPLGLDVYSQPFDHESKCLLLRSGRFRVLVLRAEDSDEIKQEAVARHLDLPGFTLRRANVGADKAYAALYQGFVRTFEPPEWLVEKCYRSRVCEHFYTAAEIDRFRARWSPASQTETEAA